MKDDKLYIIHIKECIERIESYTSGGKPIFFSDSRTQDAVLRNLHTLAESTQRLSEEMKARNSQIDWAAVSGFRNVVVHDYLGVDLEQIWQIVENDLPPLKKVVENLLS